MSLIHQVRIEAADKSGKVSEAQVKEGAGARKTSDASFALRLAMITPDNGNMLKVAEKGAASQVSYDGYLRWSVLRANQEI
jgi:hypothetical protein